MPPVGRRLIQSSCKGVNEPAINNRKIAPCASLLHAMQLGQEAGRLAAPTVLHPFAFVYRALIAIFALGCRYLSTLYPAETSYRHRSHSFKHIPLIEGRQFPVLHQGCCLSLIIISGCAHNVTFCFQGVLGDINSCVAL